MLLLNCCHFYAINIMKYHDSNVILLFYFRDLVLSAANYCMSAQGLVRELDEMRIKYVVCSGRDVNESW